MTNGVNIAFNYGTNDLWLEIFPVTTNFTVPLLLHGVKLDYHYQLHQKTNLQSSSPWQIIQSVHNSTATNVLAFSEVPTDKAAKFFRAAEGIREIQIVFEGNAVEASDTNNKAIGSFYVQHLGEPLQTNLAVHLEITGYKGSISAENDTDYVTISNVVVIPANEAQVRVLVDPFADDEIEFCEFATFTLLGKPWYLIDPDNASVTIQICDFFPTNIFTVVATNLDLAGGIDYHPPTHSLIAALHPTGDPPYNFARLYTNVVFTNSAFVTNLVITNWSGITNIAPQNEEIKLAIVQNTTNGFTAGELFYGAQSNGVIGKISFDGSVSNLNWALLSSNLTNTETLIRGSLYVDQTGIFSNDLVVVTGGGSDEGGEVWTINASTDAARLANITNQEFPHLEGAITFPSQQQIWGPWSGKIVTGAEAKKPPLIHSISPAAEVASFALGIEPEDFDLVQTNQHIYFVHEGVQGGVSDRIVKLSQNLLTNFWGGLLIMQEGAQVTLPARDPHLFFVSWRNSATNFVVRHLRYNFYLEHATFAPVDLPSTDEN